MIVEEYIAGKVILKNLCNAVIYLDMKQTWSEWNE